MDTINLQLFAVKYDKDTDYQKIIDEAVKAGDYSTAARAEQQRNAKISDLNASGTNKWGATQSTNYAQYLDTGYQGTGTHHDAGLSAAEQAAIDGYKNQYYTAKSLNDQAGMDAAHAAAEAIRNQLGYSGGGDGSEYIALNRAPGVTAPSFNFDLNSQPTFESQYGTRIDQMLNELLNRDNFKYDVAAPTYTDNYTGKINNLMGQIENRDPFSYDAAADPTFQQYQAQYNREGNRAMNDAMASAAAHAGGMNSYAMTAAQQANDYYSTKLNDKIPELTQLAYEMYMRDFDQDVAELNMLRGLGETEYNRYRDQYTDYLNERNTAYQMYLDDIEQQITDLGLVQNMDNTQYNRYRDTMSDWRNDRDFAYGMYRDDMGDYQWRSEFDYSKERDEVADNQWQQSFDHGVDQDSISNDLAYGQLTGTLPSTGQSTLGKQEFDYGKNKDANDTAWNRAMDLLASGVGFDSVVSLLVDAGFSRMQAMEIANDAEKAMAAPIGGGGGTGGNDLTKEVTSKPITERMLEGADGKQNAITPDSLVSESQLSKAAKAEMKSLELMKDSMSNQFKDDDGMYPVEKSILVMLENGTITDAEAEYMMRHFGYDPTKHFDY